MTPTPLWAKTNLQKFIFIFLTFWSAIAKVNHFLVEILALKSYCLSASEHLRIMKLLCCSSHLICVHLTLEIWEPITKFLVGSISSVSQVWSCSSSKRDEKIFNGLFLIQTFQFCFDFIMNPSLLVKTGPYIGPWTVQVYSTKTKLNAIMLAIRQRADVFEDNISANKFSPLGTV